SSRSPDPPLLHPFPTRRSSDLSAVSQQLAVLEKEAGVPLLVPTGRRVQLTPQAEILVEHTTRMLEQLELMEAEMHSSLDAVSGKDRKSTRLNSSHVKISYAVFC